MEAGQSHPDGVGEDEAEQGGVSADGLRRSNLVAVLEEYLNGKALEGLKLKDVRKHVKTTTGIDYEKTFIKDCLKEILTVKNEADDEGNLEGESQISEEDVEKRAKGKLCLLSEPLQAVVGVEEETRFRVVSLLWKYIKANDLQNASNRREILCDDNLKALFRRDKVTMTKMNALLNKHVIPKSEVKVEPNALPTTVGPSQSRRKAAKLATKGKTKAVKATTKRKLPNADKKSRGGFSKQCDLISPYLRELLDIPEESITRSEVVKRVWEYIKSNQLQNPGDGRLIDCDEAMQKVFRRPQLSIFKMNQLLSVHLKSELQWKNGDQSFNYELLDLNDEEWKKKVGDSATKKRKIMKEEAEKNGVKKRRGGFSVETPLSKDLADFMGGDKKEATRGEVVSQLWQHIRVNNLQNPDNRQQIICDEALKKLTGQDVVTQFSINKYIQHHFLSRNEETVSAQ